MESHQSTEGERQPKSKHELSYCCKVEKPLKWSYIFNSYKSELEKVSSLFRKYE